MEKAKSVLTPPEAAEYLQVGLSTLAHWRQAGRGPAFFRAGQRIRYRLADLEAFAEENLELGRAVG